MLNFNLNPNLPHKRIRDHALYIINKNVHTSISMPELMDTFKLQLTITAIDYASRDDYRHNHQGLLGLRAFKNIVVLCDSIPVDLNP